MLWVTVARPFVALQEKTPVTTPAEFGLDGIWAELSVNSILSCSSPEVCGSSRPPPPQHTLEHLEMPCPKPAWRRQRLEEVIMEEEDNDWPDRLLTRSLWRPAQILLHTWMMKTLSCVVYLQLSVFFFYKSVTWPMSPCTPCHPLGELVLSPHQDHLGVRMGHREWLFKLMTYKESWPQLFWSDCSYGRCSYHSPETLFGKLQKHCFTCLVASLS